MLLLLGLIMSLANANPVIVGSFDTQFDLTHEALQGKAWTNPLEIPDNGIDDDGNGYVDDIHGWNFIDNNNLLYEADLDIYNDENVKYGEYYMRKRAGVATPEELAWLKLHDDRLGSYHRAYIGFLHGTSSASVITRLTKNTKFIGLRTSGRDELIYDPNPTDTSVEIPKDTPAATEIEVQELVRDYAEDTFKLFNDSLHYARKARARIVQYGVLMYPYSGSAHNFQQFSYKKSGKLVPLIRAQAAVNEYYETLIQMGEKIYTEFSDMLFITAAGNSADDLDKILSFPQGVRTPNILTIGASRFRDDITPFSSFGKNSVHALIPTVNYYVAVPNNRYMMSSATSVSVVIATNLAALIMEENSNLSVLEVKRIMLETVVKRSQLKDKTVTSGIIYHDRALEAARNSRFMNLNEAIQRSFETVKD